MTKRLRPTAPACFTSTDWLRTRPLTLNTAIEYFSMSEHYNPLSLQHKIFTGELTKEQTSKLEGIVYRVVQPQPQPVSQPPATYPMFIIHEEYQKPNHHVNQTRAVYYISDGKIYTSPSIKKVLLARMKKATDSLNNAMLFFNERTTFNVVEAKWKWEEKIELEVGETGEGEGEGGKKGKGGGVGDDGEEDNEPRRKRGRMIK